jgi:hypothetical protein
VTQCEETVIKLAIEWRETRYAVAKALVELDLIHAVDMLKKERREDDGGEERGG